LSVVEDGIVELVRARVVGLAVEDTSCVVVPGFAVVVVVGIVVVCIVLEGSKRNIVEILSVVDDRIVELIRAGVVGLAVVDTSCVVVSGFAVVVVVVLLSLFTFRIIVLLFTLFNKVTTKNKIVQNNELILDVLPIFSFTATVCVNV